MATSAERNRLRVKIAGADYTLRGDASLEQLRAVANKVDELMTQIKQSNPQLDEKRAAILTALNLADQLYRLQVQYEGLVQLLDSETKSPSTKGQ